MVEQHKTLFLTIPTSKETDAFSDFSGDKSPLHIDVQFARRTRFRQCMVHGILLLLRAITASVDRPVRLLHVSARFNSPVMVGDERRLTVEVTYKNNELSITTKLEEKLVYTAYVVYEESKAQDKIHKDSNFEPIALAEITDLLEFENVSGKIDRSIDLENLHHALGQEVLIDGKDALSLALVSTVIGMRAPGRYASLLKFDVDLVNRKNTGVSISYKVSRVSLATRMLELTFENSESGVKGKATTLVLQPQHERTSPKALPKGGLLQGLRVLVIGGSGGIGGVISQSMAMEGAEVMITYHSGFNEARDLVDKIRGLDGVAEYRQLDVCSEKACHETVDFIVKQYGGLDSIIYCAVANAEAQPFESINLTDFKRQLEVSVYGLRNIVLPALPYLERTKGSVIGLSSSITEDPLPNFCSYITGKAAMDGLFRGLAVEYASKNIRFNLVSPGFVLTDLNAAASPADVAQIKKNTPMGRIVSAEEVASMVVFAASQLSSFSTGQRYVLNGGRTPFL